MLLIDMYGVIIEESKGNFIPYTLAHFPEAEHPRLIRAFREEQLFTRAGNGEMGSEEFLTRLGYADPDGAMRDYLRNWLTLDPGFKPFAEKLGRRKTAAEKPGGKRAFADMPELPNSCRDSFADKSSIYRDADRQNKGGYDLVLLSNDVAQWNTCLMELHGLDMYLDDVIVSGQVHMRKPQEDIFRYTLERLGCTAGECVFVDNSAANLRVAEKLGIHTIHFNRDGEAYEGCQVKDFQELAEVLFFYLEKEYRDI